MSRADRAKLIAGLAADASTPVANGARTHVDSLLWLAVVIISALGLTWVFGAFRPGVVAQLGAHPRFLVEILLGLAAAAALAHGAFRTALPAPGSAIAPLLPAAGLLLAWVALHLYGYLDPALAPSMAGKREHCEWQAFLFGLPALLAGCWLLRRWWPRGAASGAALGLAAGAMPALLMQLACMYEPHHMLTHHLGPGLALGPVGALIGAVALRRPSPKRRP
jgi:hypothetical protein